MLIIMHIDAKEDDIKNVINKIEANGLQAHLSEGEERCIIGAIGESRGVLKEQFIYMPGVDRIIPISQPYKLASREFCRHSSVFSINGVTIGGDKIVIIAGPCSVENRNQLLETALAVKEAGAHALRGGAYKPRSSPYSFQGMGEEGLLILAEAREITGMPIVTEVMSSEQLMLVSRYADILQVGARNMQNYSLLHSVGINQKPVLLKRGMMATIEELLMSAEYILSQGNKKVILCERGIRTFENSTRNTTDINAIPVLKSKSHLPIILDPSHSTGNWEYVAPIAKAAIACGADGLIIEVHPKPEEARSDGGQSLKPEKFAKLIKQIKEIVLAVGRDL